MIRLLEIMILNSDCFTAIPSFTWKLKQVCVDLILVVAVRP